MNIFPDEQLKRGTFNGMNFVNVGRQFPYPHNLQQKNQWTSDCDKSEFYSKTNASVCTQESYLSDNLV